jgi:methylenetetrahydrofolate dehydrogenase (NADP+)/methenyltetrahydrofolate cyclohydrolase
MAKLLTGKEVADALNKETEEKTKALKAEGIVPALAIIRVGEKAEDETYEKAILKKAEKNGIDVDQYTLPQEASTDEVVETVKMLNSDRDIHGILLMRPLPLT